MGRVEDLQDRRARPIEVVFRNGMPDRLDVAGVEVISKEGSRWRLSVRGDINPIIRALGLYDLDDLVLEHPRLEDIFMGYYQQEPSQST
jgi:hypothetical protein